MQSTEFVGVSDRLARQVVDGPRTQLQQLRVVDLHNKQLKTISSPHHTTQLNTCRLIP